MCCKFKFGHHGHLKKKQRVLGASVKFWRPSEKVGRQNYLCKFLIFEFSTSGLQTLSGSQLYTFEARVLSF